MKILKDLLKFVLKSNQDAYLQHILYPSLREDLILKRNQYLTPFLILNFYSEFKL